MNQGDAYRAELVGPGECAQASGHFLPEFDHADVAFGPVVVCGYSPVGGEPEVVSLAVEQPAGKRVVFFHHVAGRGGGGCDTDLRDRAVELDLCGQGIGVEGVGAGGDRLGDQLLHGDERVRGLGGPAPTGIQLGSVGDSRQLALGVGAAELMVDVGSSRALLRQELPHAQVARSISHAEDLISHHTRIPWWFGYEYRARIVTTASRAGTSMSREALSCTRSVMKWDLRGLTLGSSIVKVERGAGAGCRPFNERHPMDHLRQKPAYTHTRA